MNLALVNNFLTNLPKAIHEMYKPIRMKNLNMVFLYIFVLGGRHTVGGKKKVE